MSKLIKNEDGTVSKIVATEVVSREDLVAQVTDAETMFKDKTALLVEFDELTGAFYSGDLTAQTVSPVVQEEVPVSETPVTETPAEAQPELPAPVELPTPEAPVEQPAPVATPEGVTVNGQPVQVNPDGTLVVDTTPDFAIQ